MKRLLLLALALAMICLPVVATQQNFQDNTTFGNIIFDPYYYYHNTTGGNSYSGNGAVKNTVLSQSTYAAATVIQNVGGSHDMQVKLFDSSGVLMKTLTYNALIVYMGGRWEVEVVGGSVKLYLNGVVVDTDTVTVNPSRISFGESPFGMKLDDYIYGDTENKYILAGPEEGLYILKKDFVTPASTGFAFANGTTISTNNFTTTWSKGNITYTGNQSITLTNVDTGVTYWTKYTDYAANGFIQWPLNEAIFNSGAPYGRYYVTIPGTGAVSEEIWYLGSGATVSFDKSSYAGEDTATLTYSILGAYWNTSTYDYSIDIVSGTTGATMQSTAISASSGTETYTFTSTDPLGVYYGIVKATKRSDGSVIWMNYDYAELTSYVTITGYALDAETGLPISGANINITQSSIINNLTTIADGNYSATYYLSGAPITINATASTYRQYEFTFTPLSAKTININISLVPITPTTAGLGIGGVARDLAYGRPIKDATVSLINTTNAESYSKTTSFTGWYLCDEGTSCFLTTARPYDIWGEKLGYSNSANYTAVTP